MDVTKPLTKCPNCQTLAAQGKPHCKLTTCTWNTCYHCCHTYHRYTGNSFAIDRKRPGNN